MLSVYAKPIKHSIAACVLLLCGVNLPALEFKDAIETTLTTSPVVRERLHAYRQNVQDYENAFGKYYPVIDVGAYWGHRKREWDQPSTYADSSSHIEQYYIELRQNLFAGFATMNEAELERARIVSAGWYFMEMANDHALEAAKKYLAVVKQRELLQIERESLTMHERLFADMSAQEEAGTSRKSDMDEIRSKLALAYTNVRVQENNLQDAIVEFQRVYGEYVPADEFSLPVFDVQMPQTIREATKVAIRRNPSLLVMDYEIKAYENAYDISKSKYYPQVDLTLRHSYTVNGDAYNVSNEFQETRGVLSVTYNLFNGLRDSAAIQKNRSAIQEQGARREKLQRETIEGVQLGWTALENLKVIIPFLERHAELTAQRFDSYQQDFKLGYRTLLDLLIVHDDYISSRKNLIDHQVDYITAKARILDAMGELPDALNINMRQYVGLSAHVETEEVKDPTKLDQDRDGDGITAAEDVCAKTPAGAERDYVGCHYMVPLDTADFDVPPSITQDRTPQRELRSEPAVPVSPIVQETPETSLPYVEAPAYRNDRALFYFDKVTYTLTVGELERLQAFASTLIPGSIVTLYGYTDTSLSTRESLKLAEQRCETVKKVLVEAGADADRIRIKAMGEVDPIIPTGDGVLEPVNRRVEVEVKTPSGASGIDAAHAASESVVRLQLGQ